MNRSNQVSLFKGLFNKQVLWLVVVLIGAPSVHAATDCKVQTEIPVAECNALLDLYNSTGGPSWYPGTDWNQNNMPCSWTGVICNGGVVTGLYRNNNSLYGTLPSSLSALTSLTFLDLSNNGLSGSIPDLPANLTNLNLSNNPSLSGNIPNLPANLTTLNLSYNSGLSGSIPNLPASLTSLNLYGIYSLSGSIPSLPAGLTTLGLFSNPGLSGSIPSLPGGLTTLNLSGDSGLSGSIPSLPAGLTTLDLFGNSGLSGSIPSLPEGLTTLSLSGTGLSGSIPSLPASLTTLYLYDNPGLSGSIPSLPEGLITLYLSGNSGLSGSIPSLPEGLITLYLSGNSGLSVSDLSLPTSLFDLDLSNNNLSGSISSLPASLYWLNLSNNNLSGSIPSLPSGLSWIDLSNNNLSGSIPSLPAGLYSLNLSNNNLSGSIPSLPADLSSLNLSNNNLSGSIPKLPVGRFPSYATSLGYLDLSNNKLSGSIPDLPASLTSLFLQNNRLSGIIPDLNVATSLVSPNVDLSCNRFSGETNGSATAKNSYWTITQCSPLSPSEMSLIAEFSCPTKDHCILNGAYDAGRRPIENLEIGYGGSLVDAIITGTVTSKGLVSSLTLKSTAVLDGGFVTHRITNEGLMKNFVFVGQEIIGGTLAGTITMASHVNNDIWNVTLAAGAVIQGKVGEEYAPAKLGGSIQGDATNPAKLEHVTVVAGTQLDNVIIGKDVILEEGVIPGANVTFLDDSGKPIVPPTCEPNALGLDTQGQEVKGVKTCFTIDVGKKTVKITLQVDPAHVGQKADLLLIVKVSPTEWYSLDKTKWKSWNGNFDNLKAKDSFEKLPETVELEIARTEFGELTVNPITLFVGYQLPDGTVVYHQGESF